MTNKITVGDEFEGGKGELVDMVADTVANSENQSRKFEEFRAHLSGIESARWDLYWRLFCAWEGVLGEAELRERLAKVRAAAHVKADLGDRPWILTDEPVDVSAVPHETIFPGPADKTVEYHTASGRAMIWWTSNPPARSRSSSGASRAG